MTNPNDTPELGAAVPARLPNDAIEKPLGRLDNYEIADGFPDIRGWELYGSNGHQLGSVTELLADAGSRRVTQAVVDVDGRKTTVPIEFIHLDEAASRAFVSDEGVERSSLRQSANQTAMASSPQGQTRVDATESRPNDRDELDIGIKRKSEPMPPRAEDDRGSENARSNAPQDPTEALRASVQQNLAPGQSMGTPVFRDGEIRVPIIEEEIVIEKRPVIREELVIRTNTVTEQRTIHADVRKERVDIDRTDERARDDRDLSGERHERH